MFHGFFEVLIVILIKENLFALENIMIFQRIQFMSSLKVTGWMLRNQGIIIGGGIFGGNLNFDNI